MPLRRFVRLLALVLGAMLAAASAFAAWAPPAFAQPSPPAHDGYKVHMENGIKLFQDKNYNAAMIEFRAAYDAHPKASPLVNIALCYKAEFNYPKAISTLEKALNQHADSMDANDKKAAEDAIKEMRGLLAYVNVKVVPAAAMVTVDGEDVAPATASTQVPLGPGTHKIGAHLENFDPQEVEVTVASGSKDKVVSLTLTANKGFVAVQWPGMLIGLDGKFVGKYQFQGVIPPGQHVFQIYAEGRSGYSLTVPVLVIAGQSYYVRPNARGVATVNGAPIQQGVGAPPPTPTSKTSSKPLPPAIDPDLPQKKGFYVIAGPNLVWPLAHASGPDYSTNSGWSGEIMGGYRVNNVAGFQLFFEYMNVFTPETGHPTVGYTESTGRFGGGLRLMTTGRTVRLVGDADAGVAIDTPTFTMMKAGTNAKTSPQAFLVGEGGLEIDLNGVLLGGCGTLGVQTTRSTGAQSSKFGGPIGFFGLGLRVGYAFWK